MKEDILKRIDLLASKLGVASEQLYAVLFKQAYFEASISLIYVISGCVFIYFSMKGFKKLGRERLKSEHIDFCLENLPLYIGWSVLIIFAFSMVGLNLSSLGYFFNPDYFVIQKIAEVLK